MVSRPSPIGIILPEIEVPITVPSSDTVTIKLLSSANPPYALTGVIKFKLSEILNSNWAISALLKLIILILSIDTSPK